MKTPRNVFLFSIVLSMFLAGCAATPTDPKAMTAKSASITNKHSGTVEVVTSGGSSTESLGKSQVSNADFKAAIAASIAETGVFESVVSSGDGDYKISAFVTELDQPSFGFSFTVQIEVAWSLKNNATDKVIWEKMVNSEHTASTSDAFAGIVRLRLATEGAVKNNIEQAIEEISKLPL